MGAWNVTGVTCGSQQEHVALLQLHLVVAAAAEQIGWVSAVAGGKAAQRRALVDARVAMTIPASQTHVLQRQHIHSCQTIAFLQGMVYSSEAHQPHTSPESQHGICLMIA